MNSPLERGLPSFWQTSKFFLIFLVFTGLALLAQSYHRRSVNEVLEPQRIERIAQDQLHDLEASLKTILMNPESEMTQRILNGSEFPLFLYQQDSLAYWTDNSVVIPSGWSRSDFRKGYIETPNLSGICRLDTAGPYTLIGILPLQYRFPIENEFLSNSFLLGGRRFASYAVVPVSDAVQIIIHDSERQPLFGLERSHFDRSQSPYWYLALSLFFIALLSLLAFFLDLLRLGYSLWRSNWWLVAFAGDLFLLRWLLSAMKQPALFYSLSWFDSFAEPLRFFESQGETLISLLFFLFLGLAFLKWFRMYPEKMADSNSKSQIRLLDSFTAVGWLWVLLSWFALDRFWLFLLQQCEDVIEIHKVISLNFHSLLDLILMALSAAVFLLVLFKVSRLTLQKYPLKRFYLIPAVTGMIFYAVSRYAGMGPGTVSLVVLGVLILLAGLFVFGKEQKIRQLGIVLVLLVLAGQMVWILDQTNQIKEEEIQAELIDNQSNEHDPIAEMLLVRMDEEISSDSTLIALVQNPRTPEEEVRTYLLNNRFGLYWNRYKINVNICDSVNLLVFSNENLAVPCLEHWNLIKESDGQKLGDSHFYYVDNFDGKIWYLGIFPVYNEKRDYVYHLIISAESVLVPEGLGYPDVLIAGETGRDSLWDEYSYAKYQDCQLINRTGDFNYSSTCTAYPSDPDRIVHFEDGSFDHWISRLDERSVIILSKPSTSLLDHLISFSYLFVGFYIVWLVLSLVFFLPKRLGTSGLNLKSKIQISMISILVISFLLIGGGMNYFIVNQYDQTNRKTISEKIQSVLIELKHKLEFEPDLQSDWSGGDYPNLQALLVKFSYVFNTDINLFNPQGQLLASSRPEVFKRNLTGTSMNPSAFYYMNKQDQMELVHRENIGKLGFWSAYVPFVNYQGEVLAYLNLPYFSKQKELRKEVSTFLVAMLNGYFLLIFLTVVFAVFLGNQLTKPLRLLQERFSDMQLGGKNRQIEYHRRDEIGGLVGAYNQMVEQLEESAELLARSERESAWREMAKQIAHEIKNPLTPMKLSVQHLKRSWDDGVENWDSYLNRVTKTLVEQIDALSAIANEFSQFAKMPRANREEIDLVAKVQDSIALFTEAGNSNITLEIQTKEQLLVLLDREQLIQVFNNLINNALQAVPAGSDPEIRVRISKQGNHARLEVSDNGTGIPEELKDRLFQPNFTTKTSGMGLGLAISRNIIENSKGKIWFETSDTGTSFFVEFPLV